MPNGDITVTVSATEVKQYRRLVDLLEALEELIDDRDDPELAALVDDARADLLDLHGG
jgi:hypothetical protein